MFMSFNLKKLFGALGVALLLGMPLLAVADNTAAPATAPAAASPATAAPAAAPAPTPNKGDVSWFPVSTGLVLKRDVRTRRFCWAWARERRGPGKRPGLMLRAPLERTFRRQKRKTATSAAVRRRRRRTAFSD